MPTVKLNLWILTCWSKNISDLDLDFKVTNCNLVFYKPGVYNKNKYLNLNLNLISWWAEKENIEEVVDKHKKVKLSGVTVWTLVWKSFHFLLSLNNDEVQHDFHSFHNKHFFTHAFKKDKIKSKNNLIIGQKTSKRGSIGITPACGPRDLSSNPAWGKFLWMNFLN